MEQRKQQGQLWADQTMERIAAYWDYPNFNLRCKWFAEKLKQFEFASIFEVGVFSGRNLHLIQEAFPNIKIGGIDINDKAVVFAQDKLPQAQLSTCSVYDMDTSDKWDIVFTAGVLIHIPPDGIEKAIDKCLEKANRYVMHMETMGADRIVNGPAELNPINKVKDKFQWWPDLPNRYKARGKNIVLNIKVPHYRKDHPFRLIVVEV
jgi:methyltransferase family protein